jgi:predicted CXXCH cytochrome family protein
MANASGVAADGFIGGEFRHALSGIDYRVTEDGGHVFLSYERKDTSSGNELNGRQELKFFIGSGKRGRTYLFEQRGYWFESPINWYGKKRVWDMAPNFQQATEMPLTLAVDPGCLHCHASEVARSLPEARNLYSGKPFEYGGISCTACHGDASAHVASGGKADMLHIDGLQPIRRDSICLNCHLEGHIAVMREGKRSEDFIPGDDLFDYTAYFIFRKEAGAGGRATSQWEALMRSECKKQSGDRMTCTTCHDPHGSPSSAERVAFYRQKCLQCHDKSGFGSKHHPENQDCTACHMGRPPTNDIAHEQLTDHWIRTHVNNGREPKTSTGELDAISGGSEDDRDLGIAYAQMAGHGDEAAAKRALEWLRLAEHAGGGARKDHELHSNLGFLEQLRKENGSAAEEYKLALEADPYDALAAGDLALLDVREHRYGEAKGLWNEVFEHDPTQTAAGLNLAILECDMGDRRGPEAVLERILEFSPDDGKARALLGLIRSGREKCGSK